MSQLENSRIFDQAFIDSLPELGTYANAGVVMLCRYLHPFRDKVEEWFTRLPDKDKQDTWSRLRSSKDSTFSPALFELYLHEYCLNQGWTPERNPLVNGLTPDFVVDTKNECDFYLEAANVFQPPKMLGQQREVNALLDKLNALDLPFTASLMLHEWPEEQLKPAQIARNIKHKLSEAMRDGCPEKIQIDLAEYSLKGTFLAHFSEDAKKISVLYTAPIGVGLPSESTMDRALERKANKYKNLGKPYVVSICSTDLFPLNAHTLEGLMYGDIKHVFDLKTDASYGMRTGGMFPPQPGCSKVSNTNLSAVLFAELERVDRELKYVLRVYHNPWTVHPLPERIFESLPQFVSRGDANSIEMEWTKMLQSQWMPALR